MVIFKIIKFHSISIGEREKEIEILFIKIPFFIPYYCSLFLKFSTSFLCFLLERIEYFDIFIRKFDVEKLKKKKGNFYK